VYRAERWNGAKRSTAGCGVNCVRRWALELEAVQFAMLQEAVEDLQFHRPVHFLLINYYAFSTTTVVSPNHEIAEWAWVSPQQALDYPLNTFTRTLIQSYIDTDMPRRYAAIADQFNSDQIPA
jgi:hypothetical protein